MFGTSENVHPELVKRALVEVCKVIIQLFGRTSKQSLHCLNNEQVLEKDEN